MIVVIVNFLSATNIICQFTGYFVPLYGDGTLGFIQQQYKQNHEDLELSK